MPALSISAVKGCIVSPDGGEVTVTLATKYAGDISISMPANCRDELITALSANGLATKVAPAAAAAQKVTPAAAPVKAPAAAQTTAPAPPAPAVAAKVQNKAAATPATAGNLSVNVPKKWMVAADLEKHNVVIVVFNPQMDNQSGYALSAEAAKSMAAALVKNSDALSAKGLTSGSTARN